MEIRDRVKPLTKLHVVSSCILNQPAPSTLWDGGSRGGSTYSKTESKTRLCAWPVLERAGRL